MGMEDGDEMRWDEMMRLDQESLSVALRLAPSIMSFLNVTRDKSLPPDWVYCFRITYWIR